MAYNAWSVVFGEQPTAAKWNQLGTNDAGFRDGTNFADDIIDSRHYVDGSIDPQHLASTIWGYEELGRHTLGSTADDLTVSGITGKKYLMIIGNIIPSGAVVARMTFNSDTGNNYSNRNSTDGAADATQVNNGVIHMDVTGNATRKMWVLFVVNISAQEKMVGGNAYENGTTGAGNAPSKRELSAKWVNTAAQITAVNINNNAGAADFAAGSELIVLGHN